MLRLIVDEDFDNRILRGIRRREPGLDIVRAQDVGLSSHDDDAVLAWATRQARVVVTHDKATLIGRAVHRVRSGQPMRGVIAATQDTPIGTAIEDTLMIALCLTPEDLDGQVLYVPL